MCPCEVSLWEPGRGFLLDVNPFFELSFVFSIYSGEVHCGSRPMAPPFPPLTADQLAHLHDSKSREIVSVSVVMMVLAITLVAARFHARSVRKLPRKADDWLMIPAMVWRIWTLSACSVH